jgi:hypothetical protein
MQNRLIYSALLVYAGVVFGVDFIATPVKFMAPHLTLPVALEVGRATFHVLNRAEWGTLLLLAMWSAVARPAAQWYAVWAVTALIVALESAWLLPLLDHRVEVIRHGGRLPPPGLHRLYIALEGLKIAVLLSARASLPAGLTSRLTRLVAKAQETLPAPYPSRD